jgi:replicative DNA helicase
VVKNAEERGLGATYISSLMDGWNVRLPHLAFNVERVKRGSVSRKAKQRLLEVVKLDDSEIPDALDKLTTEVKDLMLGDIENDPQKLADEFVESLAKTDLSDRIKTGFPTFDRAAQGLRRGNVSVIGALPSSGKTALALCVLAEAVKSGKKAVFFSNEMTSVQLLERYSCNHLGLSYSLMNNRKLEPVDEKKAGRFAYKLANDKTAYLLDSCRYIEQQADRILRLKPHLVIVDYLQIVRTKERFNSTPDMLAWLVDEYKRLALNNNCHILILSQHSRGANQEKGKASMFNLKGSSGIEAGGDYISILDRPSVTDNKEPEEKAILKLVKNKFGRLAEVRLWFDGDKQRFWELAECDSYPVKDVSEEKPF